MWSVQSCQVKKSFVEIRSSLYVFERIACSVKCNEPVLLIGETGTGKTTLVQNLATRLGQKLTVLVCPKKLYCIRPTIYVAWALCLQNCSILKQDV